MKKKKKKIYGPICNELSKCIKSILLSQKEKKKKSQSFSEKSSTGACMLLIKKHLDIGLVVVGFVGI